MQEQQEGTLRLRCMMHMVMIAGEEEEVEGKEERKEKGVEMGEEEEEGEEEGGTEGSMIRGMPCLPPSLLLLLSHMRPCLPTMQGGEGGREEGWGV